MWISQRKLISHLRSVASCFFLTITDFVTKLLCESEARRCLLPQKVLFIYGKAFNTTRLLYESEVTKLSHFYLR